MNLKFRQATRDDLPEIVRMLADDFLGAKRESCYILQLTTNGERAAARRFYESLGFEGSHLGMKLYLK